MKKITLLTMIALLAFSACNEREEVNPATMVSYHVECQGCLVYFQDNIFNGEYRQNVVVKGSWDFKFEKRAIDTATLEIYVSVMTAPKKVKAVISTNKGDKQEFNGMINPGHTEHINLSL